MGPTALLMRMTARTPGISSSKADNPRSRDESVSTRFIMPAHSRSKNGVASLAYVAGIHVLMHQQ
jgi:hypothetical protein